MRKMLMGLMGSMITVGAFAQDDTEGKFKWSAYAETYYSFDSGKPANNLRPGFLYNFNRNNEVNLNLGLLKASYESSRVRGNVGVMMGTYAQFNMSAEHEMLRYVYEANAGIKLSKTKNLWLDAGIFPAHIGWESAIGKDCWTLTRSIAAENSPYYEAGAKITYTTDNEKWAFTGLVLNGWQRILRVDGNHTTAFGTQITYKPSAKVTLNSSTYIGNEKPDSVRRYRYFHDLYGTFQLTSKLGVIAGFDIGMEQKEKGSSSYNYWYTPALIVRYAFDPKWAMAARVEHYNDKNGVIISTETPNGFKTTGYSLNLDHSPYKNVLLRVEGRYLNSSDKIFATNTGIKANKTMVTASMSIAF